MNLIGGDVSFEINGKITRQEVRKGIESLGYTVQQLEPGMAAPAKKFLANHFPAVFILSCFYCASFASHAWQLATPALADESMDTIVVVFTGLCCWNEFFWKKRFQKHSKTECPT